MKATNLLNSITNLATAINQSYTGTCGGQLANTQLQTLNISSGATVQNAVINQNQTLTALTNCIMNNSSVVNAQNNLQKTISQQATSKVSWTSIIIIIVAVIVLIIIVGIVFAVIKSQQGKKAAAAAGGGGGMPGLPGMPGGGAAPSGGSSGGLARGTSLSGVASKVPIPQVQAAAKAGQVAKGLGFTL